MPDTLTAALATQGLAVLIAVAFAGGLVRGFTGFGSGLVILPVAAGLLGPVAAITAVIIADLFGPLPILRRALRDVHIPDLSRLIAALLMGLPLGVIVLLAIDPQVFRYILSAVVLIVLALLITGLRFRGTLSTPVLFTAGGAGGFLGGATGIPGPPVILIYLASTLPAPAIRATILFYLLAYDVLLLGSFSVAGRLSLEAVWLGLILAIPNALGNLAGAAVFTPQREVAFRAAAYLIITGSALSALPVWG